ncbi:MAG TPA: hypothetical protein VJJ22_05320 [Candidatus Paceibacterota bacterium]
MKPRGALECFKELVNSWPVKKGTKGRQRYFDSMSASLGTGNRVVDGWSYGRSKPKGLSLLKLAIYLEEKGYVIDFCEKMRKETPSVFALAKLCASGKIKVEEAQARIGYKNIQDVFQIILGRRGLWGSKLIKIDEILAEYGIKPELSDSPISQDPIQGAQSAKSITDRVFNELFNEQSIECLAYLLRAILPLAKMHVSHRFQQSDRVRLREMVGAKEMAEVNILISQLCSEASLKHHEKNGRKG